MELFPAIDLKGGRAVRAVVAGDDPLAVARALVVQGARWLHVADMDRAFETGEPPNDALVRELCGLDVAVQVGGNVVDVGYAATVMGWGARRVVLGTWAALDVNRLIALVTVVGAPHAALAVDVRGGRVALRGARQATHAEPAELVRRAMEHGVSVVVYRDLDQDGLLTGGDLDGAARLVDTGAQILLAGGVASLDTLYAARERGIAGVIVGRALHERRFTLEAALECC